MISDSVLEVLGYPVYSNKLEDIELTSKKVINTINQYSYCIAEEDEEFKKALRASDILLPDGIGIVWAASLLKGKKINKIAGADIHQYLLEKLNESNGSCFYLGASSETLDKIQKRISNEYMNVKVSTYSPPYKSVFSKEDTEKMINEVNLFKPDVLFVGMTAPKQEKWVYEAQKHIQTKAICSIGAVFDFYAGTVNRPSKFWINLKLEWFVRLIKEPQRLWRRYLYYGPVFVFQVLREKMKRLIH